MRELDYVADLSARGDGYEMLTWIFAAALGGGETPDPTAFKVRILVDGNDVPVGDVVRAMLQSGDNSARPLVLCAPEVMVLRAPEEAPHGKKSLALAVGHPKVKVSTSYKRKVARVELAAKKFCAAVVQNVPGLRPEVLRDVLPDVVEVAATAGSIVRACGEVMESPAVGAKDGGTA